MLTQPMDILQQFPIRKSKEQKQKFRDAVKAYTTQLGYPCKNEAGNRGTCNVVIGDPEKAEYLITAHYDTPASIGLPNIITPKNLLFYLFWQIFIVGILIVLAVAVGYLVWHFTGIDRLAFLAGYAVYMGILILMLFGPANKNNANDNTSGVVMVLETARTLPENLRSKVCFVLFDMEERGLVGSSLYRKSHKNATDNQLILNLDCVGDGDEMVMFPTKKLKKDENIMASLDRICGHNGNKILSLHKKGFYVYPSDQRNFPKGVGIAAFKRSKLLGLYCDKIHTKRDTTLDQTNVNILRAALTTLVANDK